MAAKLQFLISSAESPLTDGQGLTKPILGARSNKDAGLKNW